MDHSTKDDGSLYLRIRWISDLRGGRRLRRRRWRPWCFRWSRRECPRRRARDTCFPPRTSTPGARKAADSSQCTYNYSSRQYFAAKCKSPPQTKDFMKIFAPLGVNLKENAQSRSSRIQSVGKCFLIWTHLPLCAERAVAETLVRFYARFGAELEKNVNRVVGKHGDC